MIIRSLFLLLPLIIWVELMIGQRLSTMEAAATFLGFVWAFLTFLLLNIVILRLDIWTILISDNLFYGVPLDWVSAQAIVVGALIPLARLRGIGAGIRALLQGGVIVVMCTYPGILEMQEPTWGLAVLAIIAFSAAPALLMSDWTAKDTHIRSRSFLQSLSWAVFLLWFFPSTVFQLTAGSWAGFLQRDLSTAGVYLLPLLLPAYLLISALYQFAVQGNGTAFPYDPPKRLVTGGVYRYLSNPMQLGICLAMGWWGIVIQSVWISVSALVAVTLFIVFKDVCDGSCTIGSNNEEWETYQQSVPKWWPQFRL